jgi:hypothetical protein
MKQTVSLFLLGFFVNQGAFAQTILKGKIILEASNLEGIDVVNLNNDKSVKTLKFGYFSIEAKPNDTLLILGFQIKGERITIKEEDFSKNLFFIRLKPQVNQLAEVVVKNYNGINAFSLGIISRKMKSYTPAERRLRASSVFALDSNHDGSMGGSIGIDPLFNWMSGRTARLTKELEVEKKELLIVKLSSLFDSDFYSNTLKIPLEYINGFKFFIADDIKLSTSIASKNKALTLFLLTELAEKYKLVISPKE